MIGCRVEEVNIHHYADDTRLYIFYRLGIVCLFFILAFFLFAFFVCFFVQCHQLASIRSVRMPLFMYLHLVAAIFLFLVDKFTFVRL